MHCSKRLAVRTVSRSQSCCVLGRDCTKVRCYKKTSLLHDNELMRSLLNWNTCLLKISLLPSKPCFSANCSFFGQSFSIGHYPPINQPPKEVYLLNIYLFLGEEWGSRYKWFQGNRSVSTSYDETEKYETRRLSATSLNFVLLQQNLEQSKTKIRLPQFAPTWT